MADFSALVVLVAVLGAVLAGFLAVGLVADVLAAAFLATGFFATVFVAVFAAGAFAAGFLATGFFAAVLAVFLAGVRPAARVGDLVAVLRVVAIFTVLRQRPDPAISAGGFEREKPPNTSGITVMFRGFVNNYIIIT
ncbi:MAG: hypothetical protein VYC90_05580 [Pseudomonadota bacterium]|nr:hypothetical protein [Pseudomonadota bacterium]